MRWTSVRTIQTLFVPLASITEPELVLPRIAAVVGATIEGNRSPLDALIEHFADTPTLLILDNLEQVIGVARISISCLSSCPELKILATSRTVLRLRAEREYAVAALAVPSLVGTAVGRSSSPRCPRCSCSSIEPRRFGATSR